MSIQTESHHQAQEAPSPQSQRAQSNFPLVLQVARILEELMNITQRIPIDKSNSLNY